ncbi:Rz1-like lysis system protein LysC [Pseudomonas guariconensis]|uniref:Rz1-like lysis system protein LysC n=1 Tax=Pseudomonas guariconensis TaxID=1288410 RepID=UPI003F68DD0B
MTRNYVTGALSLSLLLLVGCTRDLPSPEPTVTVSGCPIVTPCTLSPAAPINNDGLSDDSDYLLSAWAECAAKVDSVIQYRTRPVQEAP